MNLAQSVSHFDFVGLATLIGAVATFIVVVGGFVLQAAVLLRQTKNATRIDCMHDEVKTLVRQSVEQLATIRAGIPAAVIIAPSHPSEGRNTAPGQSAGS